MIEEGKAEATGAAPANFGTYCHQCLGGSEDCYPMLLFHWTFAIHCPARIRYREGIIGIGREHLGNLPLDCTQASTSSVSWENSVSIIRCSSSGDIGWLLTNSQATALTK
jgi:hypothetical protein